MDPSSARHAPLRDQLDQMTRRLIAAERRAQTLAELNRLLAQGRDPLAFAQRAVDLVMRASGAGGTFVYLWDDALDRLVMRVATRGRQAAYVNQAQLRLGEGITGWSALMRQTVVIHDDIQQDPRFVSFPDLDEDSFRSMVAVPIVVAGGELLGVFSLWSTEPHAFEQHDVDLATEVGGLLASGLVQARMVEDLRRQSAAARFLQSLPPEVTSSLQRCLDVLAVAIRDQVDATLCTIEVSDRAGNYAPVRPGVALSSDVGTSVVVAAGSVRTRVDLAELAQRLGPGQDKLLVSFGHLFPLGAITCYRDRPFSSSDASLVEALSAQIATLVASFGNLSGAIPLAARLANAANAREAERLLYDLGWRRDLTHTVFVRVRSSNLVSPASFARMVGTLEDLSAPFDGVVLVPSAPSVSILVRHDGDQWRRFEQALHTAFRALRAEAGVIVTAGVGAPANEVAGLLISLEEAETAALWAELLDESVIHHDDVAHLRTLPKVAVAAGGDLRDSLARFAELVRYDIRHGTSLANTLDVYLAHRCSINETAAALYIHRNTLRQRLSRIAELTGRSIDDAEDWTLFALAARLSVAEGAPLSKPRPLGEHVVG